MMGLESVLLMVPRLSKGTKDLFESLKTRWSAQLLLRLSTCD